MPEDATTQKPPHIGCPSCGSGAVDIFHRLDQIPVQSVLNIGTFDEAVAFPRGDIHLSFCSDCGFISNKAFEEGLMRYTTGYEATQSYSPTFTEFAKRQAQSLINKFDLYNKNLLEIGCGNGEFLQLLCELGNNRGTGFDPAYVEGRVTISDNTKVTFIKDYYSDAYAEHQADFLYCKMTLEHIHQTGAFIASVGRATRKHPETIVFFQVPDVTRILRDCAFEDIYYEHCSYFSPGSLSRLFKKSGFDVMELYTDYAEQYLIIVAQPTGNGLPNEMVDDNDLDTIKTYVAKFPDKFDRMMTHWHDKLQTIVQKKQRAVIWGSGSKGVAFLTTTGVKEAIQHAIDINPHRQGTYMAGTGHEIKGPGFLKDFKPDIVIVMNAVYKDEIQRDLARMNLKPTIWTL
jgi:SAM-dependent methyltransferase